jgi:HAMP domain-containing protein
MAASLVQTTHVENKNGLIPRTYTSGIWLIRLSYAVLALSAILEIVTIEPGIDSTGIIISAIIRLIAAGVLFFAEILVKRGRTLAAALIVPAISLSVMGLFDPLNIGWLVGIVVGLLLSLISIQLMPVNRMGLGIFIAFAGGSIVAFMDFIRSSIEYTASLTDPQIILLIVLSAALAVIIFRRFTSYPVTAKFVLAIASLTTVILNILGIVISAVVSGQAGATPEIIRSMNMYFLLGSQLGIVLSSLTAFLLARLITTPLSEVVALADRIAQDGDLSRQAKVYYPDEVGRMAESFNHMIDILDGLAGEAARVARGDLTVEFAPRSGQDVLGKAFALMTHNLRGLVGQISENSEQVSKASGDLANAAQFAG